MQEQNLVPPATIPPPAELKPAAEIPLPLPGRDVWGFWATVGLGAAVIAVWFLCQFIITIAFAVREILASPGFDAGQLMQIAADGGFLSTVTIVSSIVAAGLTTLFIYIKKNASFANYLALQKPGVKPILVAVGVTVLLLLFEALVSTGSGDSGFADLIVTAYKNSTTPYLLWIAIVLIGPAFEEMLFRGFLYAGLSRSALRVPGAIFITALLWSVLHGTQYDYIGLVVIFVTGLALGILRWKTGSIWNCYAMHVLFNLAAMVQIAIAAGSMA